MITRVERILEELMSDEMNRLWADRPEPAWDSPIAGVCRGDDPMFSRFKEVVGPIHWIPVEAFEKAYPEVKVQPEELAVFSWILPQTENTKRDNRAETALPSERWARSRIFGEKFNEMARHEVAARLTADGILSVAPMALSDFTAVSGGPYGRMSTWSERHVAFASGLGTFGLCDGLITPRGKAMRAGSVVAKLRVESIERPYTDHHAYCLFYANGTCGRCIERCPADALSTAGHDKDRCAAYLRDVTRPYVTEAFGFEGYGCGLCQTGTPCESRIPKGLD